jgi:hypothetical protein
MGPGPPALRTSVRTLLFLSILASLLAACPRPTKSAVQRSERQTPPLPVSDSAPQRCLDAAKETLGPNAEVLKYGHLTGSVSLEAVAVVRPRRLKDTEDGVAISRLLILRQEKSGWAIELKVDKDIRNSAGCIASACIEDSHSSQGLPHFRVSFADHRSDDTAGFVIYLAWTDALGNVEGVPVQISWNSSVGRFQEYDPNVDPPGFQPEIKDLPHVRTK